MIHPIVSIETSVTRLKCQDLYRIPFRQQTPANPRRRVPGAPAVPGATSEERVRVASRAAARAAAHRVPCTTVEDAHTTSPRAPSTAAEPAQPSCALRAPSRVCGPWSWMIHSIASARVRRRRRSHHHPRAAASTIGTTATMTTGLARPHPPPSLQVVSRPDPGCHPPASPWTMSLGLPRSMMTTRGCCLALT